jgi:ubiquinone/menaquinone biosynthesis C-methylase UbiE
MDLQTYRQTSLRTWGEMAPGWEDRREWIMDATGAVNEWLIAQADPQPGETVLELAAGTGDLGFMAAQRVGGDGRLICTDFAPEMLEVSRRNGEAQGVANAEFVFPAMSWGVVTP